MVPIGIEYLPHGLIKDAAVWLDGLYKLYEEWLAIWNLLPEQTWKDYTEMFGDDSEDLTEVVELRSIEAKIKSYVHKKHKVFSRTVINEEIKIATAAAKRKN